MGTYFYAIVELDDGPVQMNPEVHQELTLGGHTDTTDPRVRGVLSLIAQTPRRVTWMSDYSREYQSLEEEWMQAGVYREKSVEVTIPADIPGSALDLPFVADIDGQEFIDAREWADYCYPLPVLAGQYLTGSMAQDEAWPEFVGRWCGHRLRATPDASEFTGFTKITPHPSLSRAGAAVPGELGSGKGYALKR